MAKGEQMNKIRLLASAYEMGELNYPLDYFAIEIDEDDVKRLRMMLDLATEHRSNINEVSGRCDQSPYYFEEDELPDWENALELYNAARERSRISINTCCFMVSPHSIQIHSQIGFDHGIVRSNCLDLKQLEETLKIGSNVLLDLREHHE